MFASPVHHQKHTARRVSTHSPILKHLNTGTLALAMFVALALLSPIRGKEPETKDSAPGKATKSEAVTDKHGSDSSCGTESAQGYLQVYSAANEFKNGDERYFPHSAYTIYTIDGTLFKKVKNQRSGDDEIPEVVALPVGTYFVEARSQRGGYVGMLVVIKEGQESILDLDLWETQTQQRRLAHN